MAERDTGGFRFDLRTQRFIRQRWETELGEEVRHKIIEGIRQGIDLRGILDPYVLEHPENSHPYAHPYFPPDAMSQDHFWVLTQNDLRGISLHGQDFSRSNSLSKKELSYARIHACKFVEANLESAGLSYASLERCDFTRASLAGAYGLSAKFTKSLLVDACLWEGGLIEADLSGADLRGAYFEHARLDDLDVDYETRFDDALLLSWKTRSIKPGELPQLLKQIRLAFQRQEIWTLADRFLEQERKAFRRAVLFPAIARERTLRSGLRWLEDLSAGATSGYGTRPGRVVFFSIGVAMAFALIFFLIGAPAPSSEETIFNGALRAAYFSATVFATLGFGDVTYLEDRPFARMLSVSEAWIGAVLIALFVTSLARKAFR